MQSFDIKVTFNGGAYVTQTVRGQRASSTCSADVAAQRLGEKLFPETLIGVHHLRAHEGDGCSITRWRLVASTEE